jgi:hypothetical protein
MGDNLVPNGLSRSCRVFCSKSKYVQPGEMGYGQPEITAAGSQ